MNKVKVSVVSYLNSKPFLYGLQKSGFVDQLDLSLDIPSTCAQKLIDGQVDIGLIPVATIPMVHGATIISDYCIGAVGDVGSVILYSDVPLDQIRTIYLDFQSRTSIRLVQLLAKEFWKLNVQFLPATEGFEQRISGDSAAVVIGDRTFDLKGKHRLEVDLAGEWMRYTGLPFVFACWVANKPLPDTFLKEFNAALKVGIDQREDLIHQLEERNEYHVDVRQYLMQSISFEYDSLKREALDRFLNSEV